MLRIADYHGISNNDFINGLKTSLLDNETRETKLNASITNNAFGDFFNDVEKLFHYLK
jgi:hypothetical protein